MANLSFQTTIFGGLNKSDQPDKLLLRSHQQSENGFVQIGPSEALEMVNIDFDQRGIKKRDGSTIQTTALYSLLSVGEFIVNSIDYTSSNGQAITVVVTSISIYTTNSGTFTQVNDSTGSSYSHSDTVSKSTFAVSDGHLFIGLDGANKIQVYKNGEDLDEELDAGNTYEDSFGSGTYAIDGTWGSGYYLLADFQGRLIYSDGNTVVNYSEVPTTSSGVWKRSTHGFFQCSGNIISLYTFTPDYQDSIQETLYVFTSNGPQITNDLTGSIHKIENGPVPVNYKTVIATKSWLMILTKDRQIIALNRNNSVDIGRRFTDNSGLSSIENFDISNSDDIAFSFYNKKREQVYFFVPDSGFTYNTRCFVVDLQLSEPIAGAYEDIGENRVRLAEWEIYLPTTNSWYYSLYQRFGQVYGIAGDGKIYALFNGRNDFGSVKVEATYESMDFNAGLSSYSKQWMMLYLRGQFIGNYETTIKYIIDKGDIINSDAKYSQASEGSIYGTFKYGTSLYRGLMLIKGQDDVDLYSESIRFRLFNDTLSQTFRFDTIELEYLVGSRER